ncbi:MAG: fasciclin domain-containing protein [Pseudomonadota bacterium]
MPGYRHLFAAALLGTTLLGQPALAGSKGKASGATIVDVAASTGTFETLLVAAKAAGLAGVLDRENLTVFAPTDAAFAKLPHGTVESLLQPENRDALASVLSYHVVRGNLTSDIIPTGASRVRTLNGGQTVTLSRGSHRLSVNGVNVRAIDVPASNGFIHVIDGVLLPPAPGH